MLYRVQLEWYKNVTYFTYRLEKADGYFRGLLHRIRMIYNVHKKFWVINVKYITNFTEMIFWTSLCQNRNGILEPRCICLPIYTHSEENNWNYVIRTSAQFQVSHTVACFHIMADTALHIELMMLQENLLVRSELKQSPYSPCQFIAQISFKSRYDDVIIKLL
jgi:hypothetical protein